MLKELRCRFSFTLIFGLNWWQVGDKCVKFKADGSAESKSATQLSWVYIQSTINNEKYDCDNNIKFNITFDADVWAGLLARTLSSFVRLEIDSMSFTANFKTSVMALDGAAVNSISMPVFKWCRASCAKCRILSILSVRLYTTSIRK